MEQCKNCGGVCSSLYSNGKCGACYREDHVQNPEPIEIVYSEPAPVGDKLMTLSLTRAQWCAIAEGLRLYLAIGPDIDAKVAHILICKELKK